MPKALLLGGGGFVGSNVACAMLKHGFHVTIVDDFSNSYPDSTSKLVEQYPKYLEVIRQDLLNLDFDLKLLSQSDILVHLAGKKSIQESIRSPRLYLERNVMLTQIACKLVTLNPAMCWIFSSSCTVYEATSAKISETSRLGPSTPYGWSKLIGENLFEATSHAYSARGISLRYFNPVGADQVNQLGERSRSVDNMVSERIMQAVQSGMPLKVFRAALPTRDGTCIRDYVDVRDVAEAHVLAAERLLASQSLPNVVNLGSDEGTTTLELIERFKTATNVEIPFILLEARPGDASFAVARSDTAFATLDWTRRFSLSESVEATVSLYASNGPS